MTDKRSLRATLRARRDAAPRMTAIEPPPAFLERLASTLVVASYVPLGSEADPTAFERAARAAGGRIALPHVVDRATPLRFLLRRDGEALAAGPFGLANPQPDWPEMTPDIILTPLLGFDRRGHRLGQGAGHYDRAFAACPAAWRIGIAWSGQEIDDVPADAWDVPLHAVATEREWIDAA